MELNKSDFILIYDLRCVGFLKGNGFKPILVAKNKDNNKVFSMYYKDYRLMKVLDEYEVVEADRLARIEYYVQRNKEIEKSKREI